MAEITLLATWPAQDNAEGFRVRLLDAQGAQLDLQDVATKSATFGALAELTTYQLELIAYHAAGESDPQLLTLTTPEGETGTSSLMVAWEDAASGDTARLLDGTGTLLQDLGAVTVPITLSGLATDVGYQLELTRADTAVEVIAFTTPASPPGVTNLQHTFTTDSLTFTWDAAAGADDYLLTLSRAGAEVATQTVTTLTATFSTLEDGTQYNLTIQASNAQGTGPIAYYQATTGYIAPAAPTNLRQFEERIIAVICRWDLAEPDKVFDVEVQLLYGTDLVLADALEGAATERTIIVPMASTDYLLRVRAGNPGGWSPWAEATVFTEVFPIIDSRLAVMGAGYQEDVLHTDTWDGASDASGIGSPQVIDASANFQIIDARLSQPIEEAEAFTFDVTVGDITSRNVNKTYWMEIEKDAFTFDLTVGDITSRNVNKTYYMEPENDAFTFGLTVGDITSINKVFTYSFIEDEAFTFAITVGDITSEVPV